MTIKDIANLVVDEVPKKEVYIKERKKRHIFQIKKYDRLLSVPPPKKDSQQNDI